MTDENREAAALSIISRYCTKINDLSYVEQEKEPAALRGRREGSSLQPALKAEQRFLDKLIKDEKVDAGDGVYMQGTYPKRMERRCNKSTEVPFF